MEYEKLDGIHHRLTSWEKELSAKLHSIEYAGNMPIDSDKHEEYKKLKEDLKTCHSRLERFANHRPLRYKKPISCMCCS
jgi:hypothetical protein